MCQLKSAYNNKGKLWPSALNVTKAAKYGMATVVAAQKVARESSDETVMASKRGRSDRDRVEVVQGQFFFYPT